MILQYQDRVDENNGNLTEVMLQIRTKDMDDFYKWLDIINSWYSIKQARNNMVELMEELNGRI